MNKVIIGAWAASLGVAFYAGYSSSLPSQNVQQTGIVKSKSDSSKINKDSAGTGDTRNPNAEKNKGSLRISTSPKARMPVSAIVAELESLSGDSMMGSMDMDSYVEAYNLTKAMNEEELAEALELLDIESLQKTNMRPLLLLLSRYTEFNPINAVAFYEANITSGEAKNSALSSILSKWSKNDPDAAYEWFMKSADENPVNGVAANRSFGWFYIFQGLAKNDIASTIEKLEKVGTMGYKDQMAANGLSSAFREKEEFLEFFEQAKDLDNKKIKENVLRNWVRKSPKEAVAWLDTLEKDQRSNYDRQVLHGWMDSNPTEAADWFIENADDKQKATDTAASHWSWRNPQAALHWVESQEGINTTASVKRILENAVYQHADFVIKNLDKIGDEKSRLRLSERIYKNLKSRSERKAADFLASSPYKDDLNKKFSKKKK